LKKIGRIKEIMEKAKRLVFFWFLAILFFLIAPVVILYSQGFLFDFKKGVFVHSGTITFKSNPQAVDVSLNGEKKQSQQRTDLINGSSNISSIFPGDYNIEISKDNFQAWSKKTTVYSGLSSEFWNVVLARKSYEKIPLDTKKAEKFFVSPQNDFLVFVFQENENFNLKIFDIKNEKINNEFSFPDWNLVEEERRENIEWSPRGKFLSVPVKKNNQNIQISQIENSPYAYFIVNLEKNIFLNLNEAIKEEDIQDVRWDPQEQNYVFFINKKNSSLMRADTQNPSDLKEIASDVSSYDLSGSRVYYVKNPSNLVFRKDIGKEMEPVQITQNFSEENKIIYRLIIYDDSKIAFISEDKNFYIFNKGEYETYFKKLGENVSGIHFSDDGKKVAFWTPNEISVYFTRDWLTPPLRAENETQNITRYSEPIKNVQWFNDYEHIVFSSGSWAKIIELDSRDHRNCMDLFNTTIENPFIIYDGFLEKIYFTDRQKDINGIYSINFPEKVPFLGIGG